MVNRRNKGGVHAKRDYAIGLTIHFQGRRFRPTLSMMPTEANLRRARARLDDINQRIRQGTFNLLEEFPEYRCKKKYADLLPAPPRGDRASAIGH